MTRVSRLLEAGSTSTTAKDAEYMVKLLKKEGIDSVAKPDKNGEFWSVLVDSRPSVRLLYAGDAQVLLMKGGTARGHLLAGKTKEIIAQVKTLLKG